MVKKTSRASSAAKANPFERVVSKTKHKVLGRRIKGQVKDIGHARGRSEQLRKETLLIEKHESKKNNTFADRRFGEHDASLNTEDRMLMRFQRDKARAMRLEKSAHTEKQGVSSATANTHTNTNTTDTAEAETLTHGGQSLDFGTVRDDYIGSEDEDEDPHAHLSADLVRSSHFGGDGDDGKSTGEVYAEIIAKSKQFKAEKQKQKAHDTDLLAMVDAQFADMRNDLFSQDYKLATKGKMPKKRPETAEEILAELRERAALEALLEKEEEEKEAQLQGTKAIQEAKRIKASSAAYDMALRQLATEQTTGGARAANRTLSLEEKIAVERKRLVKLEKERLERMSGETKATGDSLKDDYALENGSESEEVEEADMEGKDKEGARSWVAEVDIDDIEARAGETVARAKSKSTEGQGKPKERKESKKSKGKLLKTDETATTADTIPFVIPAPASYGELKKWIEGRSVADQKTIFDRMIAYNHPKLPNMGVPARNLYTYLDVHYAKLSEVEPLPVEELGLVMTEMHGMCQDLPDFAAGCARARIRRLFDRMAEDMGYWPSRQERLYLRLVSILFPVTDFQHPVVTPALVCLSACLATRMVTNLQDAMSGVLVALLGYLYVSETKRYMPEPLLFLDSVLKGIGLSKEKQGVEKGKSTKAKTKTKTKTKKAQGKSTDTPVPIDLSFVSATKDEVIYSCIHLVSKFAKLYKALPAFETLFAPVAKTIAAVEENDVLLDSTISIAQTFTKWYGKHIKSLHKDGLEPLKWLLPKAKVQKSLVPKVHADYSMEKHYDTNRARAEESRLRYKVKRTRKEAMRELRKDTGFLQREHAKARTEWDQERDSKFKEISKFLEHQQGNFHKLEREKKLLKKRKREIV